MDLPSWIDKEAWEGFVTMRKSIKKPLTERAIKLSIHKLESLLKQGFDPTAVLDQSTFNSWQGLFPIKEGATNVRQETSGFRGRTARNFATERDEIRKDQFIRLSRQGNMGSSILPTGQDVDKHERQRDSDLERGTIESTCLEVRED